MKLFIVSLLLLQLGPRVPLTPAETLLPWATLAAIRELVDKPVGEPGGVTGIDPAAGEIIVSCQLDDGCASGRDAIAAIRMLVEKNTIPRPARSIRFITWTSPTDIAGVIEKDPGLLGRTRAAIDVYVGGGEALTIIRSPWSRATIADELVEVFATQPPFGTEGVVRIQEYAASRHHFEWASYGVPTVQLLGGEAGLGAKHAAFVTAAAAYFLATLPNQGSEALLSHLSVGAHARLAEDGRKAVAQMGSQQRASADVLIMLGQAIEREQRRMRSFERFMPSPVDPMLHSRIVDMEKGITSVWTSMGITSSPFVPAAERIRGRGGDDRRVPVRTGTGPLPRSEPPTALLKFTTVDGMLIAEFGNFIDGKRTISDIRDAVSAEFSPMALPVVSDYFDRLAKAGAISFR